MGPKILPWGTPHITCANADFFCPQFEQIDIDQSGSY